MLQNIKFNFLRNFPVFSPILFLLIFILIGLYTPEHKFANHTISRLSIQRYGWIQQLNFLQFAFGVLLSGKIISENMIKPSSKKLITRVFYFCVLLLILAAIIPTDPIENRRLISLSLFTPLGLVHLGIVLLFLIFSPYGINRIVKVLKTEPNFRDLSSLTAIMGYGAFLMSLVWLLFFGLGLIVEYRGLFQKIIAVWVLTWLIIINLRSASVAKTKDL